MEIKFYPRYVVDACVLLAYLDTEDVHHNEALKFFETLDKFTSEGRKIEVVLPAHLYLEVNLNIEKKKEDVRLGKRKKFESKKNQNRFDQLGYPISLEFMTRIEKEGLYEKFGLKLRSSDFIYAAIAHMESIPLVTFDKKDFSKVVSDINVVFLNKN